LSTTSLNDSRFSVGLRRCDLSSLLTAHTRKSQRSTKKHDR
jgi:hypothetical protein